MSWPWLWPQVFSIAVVLYDLKSISSEIPSFQDFSDIVYVIFYSISVDEKYNDQKKNNGLKKRRKLKI